MKSKPLILSIVGARPQFIKLAPLASELEKKFNHKIIHTGQHYDRSMSDIFFKQLKLPEIYKNLNINGGTNCEMVSRMIDKLEKELKKNKPEFVIVYGDTNSTLAGSLTAASNNIPVGHVEAGMRSFDLTMPEETNRKLTDQLTTLFFCPTKVSIRNLKNENIKKHIIHSGDLMYELLEMNRPAISKNYHILNQYDLPKKQYIYLTFHRSENVDCKENLKKLIEILQSIDKKIIFSIHPRTEQRLTEFGLMKKIKQIEHLKIIKPAGYIDSMTITANASYLLTDSGGLQKEALYLGTPVLTLRNCTEWEETLKMGNQTVALDKSKIVKKLKNPPEVKKISYKIRNRKPSQIIADSIYSYLKNKF